jgi:hypothetical protein
MFVQILGQVLFKGEIITKMKNVNMGWAMSFKNLFQNHWAKFYQTWHKSFRGRGFQLKMYK